MAYLHKGVEADGSSASFWKHENRPHASLDIFMVRYIILFK